MTISPTGRPLPALRPIIAILAILVAALALSTPARADLRVCNETGNPVSIALGYKADRGWQTEGLWVAPPARCAIVYQGKLTSRFFYLYVADDIGGGAWDGTFFMCTRDETFTIFDTGDCLARGYERTGFFEVDTQNKTDWTLQLKDPVNNDTAGPDTGDEMPLEGEDAAPLEGDGE